MFLTQNYLSSTISYVVEIFLMNSDENKEDNTHPFILFHLILNVNLFIYIIQYIYKQFSIIR